MKISTERAEVALKHCKRMRLQINPAYSDAGDWWDNLTPEWRGVVLHAAAVTSGAGVFKAHLSKCCWRELYERLGYRDMIQLRRGISRARLTF